MHQLVNKVLKSSHIYDTGIGRHLVVKRYRLRCIARVDSGSLG